MLPPSSMYNHLNKCLYPHTCTFSENHTQFKATATEAAYALSAEFNRFKIEESPEGRATNEINTNNKNNNPNPPQPTNNNSTQYPPE